MNHKDTKYSKYISSIKEIIAYAKKGWYENAISEARNAFDLFPTDKNKKVLELIKSKKKNSSN